MHTFFTRFKIVIIISFFLLCISLKANRLFFISLSGALSSFLAFKIAPLLQESPAIAAFSLLVWIIFHPDTL